MNDDILWTVRKKSVLETLKKGEREDGRKFDEIREIEIQEGYVPKAEGSCLVKLGGTQVLVGVKMDVGEPYSDHEKEGNMVTNAELVPIAAPIYYSGPPSPESIELARVVDRGIRESKMIDFEKLCIIEGEKVWTALIDLHVLDFNGNLFDTATIGAIKALWNTKMPKYDKETNNISRQEYEGKVPVQFKPITATFAKIGNAIVIDPSLIEEKVADAKMVISIRDDDHMAAAQKIGKGSFTKQELDQMLETAIKKTKEIRKLI